MKKFISSIALAYFTCFAATSRSEEPKPDTLDDLVKLYDQFELPCPPKGAQLCICEEGYDRDELSNGGPVEIQRFFGYLTKPYTKRSREVEIYRGIILDPLRLKAHVKIVSPVPESLSQVNHFRDWELLIAIQSQKLGHKELANWIFQKYVQQYRDEHKGKMKASQAREEVIDAAEYYWSQQVSHDEMDRKVTLKNLKALHHYTFGKSNTNYDSMILSLEQTVTPRKSKPGSLDLLFDDLVDANTKNITESLYLAEYHQLLKHGFDIVPKLIEHLDDIRYTRATYYMTTARPQLTVSNVCNILLDEIAGKQLPRIELSEKELEIRKNARPGLMLPIYFSNVEKFRPLKKEDVKSWWDQAKATGERQYLLNHLYKRPLGRVEVESETRYVNRSILTMIATRYPGELKGIYYEALDSKRQTNTSDVINAILHASLDKPRFDRQVKRSILQRGLTHSSTTHRYDAEMALAKIDPDEYSQRLLKRLERMPMKIDDIDKHIENEITMQCYGSNDPRVWTDLERSIKRSPANIRFNLLEKLSNYYHEESNTRHERLRILAGFLDDKTVRTPEEVEKRDKWGGIRAVYDQIELRNYCVIVLAPFFNEWIDYDEYRSNDEWACLRKWIKDEVEGELKKTKLPPQVPK